MGDGYNSEGVSGLKALGVRDLNYRLSFLACSVQSSEPEVRTRYRKAKGGGTVLFLVV